MADAATSWPDARNSKQPFEQGKTEFVSQIAKIKNITNYPEQLALVKDIEQQIAEWQINAMDPALALRADIGDAPTMNDIAQMVGESHGLEFFRQFRAAIEEFEATETALLNERLTSAQQALEQTNDLKQQVQENARSVKKFNAGHQSS